MTRIRWYGPTLVLLMTVLIAMVVGPSLVARIAWAQTDARIRLVQNQMVQSEFLQELSQAFRQVSDVVEPSVVSIQVSTRRGPNVQQQPFPELPPGFEDFFGPFGPRRRPQPQPQPDPQGPDYQQYNPALPYGNGSGWVYDAQGHIVTNRHVVADADEITVRFSDGTSYKAQIVGVDPDTDIAVLKVEAQNLHPAVVAQTPVEQGDIVFAFGSPFRFDFSMSMGIVSAKGRQLGIIVDPSSGRRGYENFIQTDAAINPGNSGGPLTNIYGQVVGMNTAIASRTGAYNGLGFAIPASMVTDVVNDLIADGKVSRGYLGIYIRDVTSREAQTFGYNGSGVLVVDPIAGSPAAQAGLKAGDIITEVNSQPIASADDLRYTVAGLRPGSNAALTVFRNGEAEVVNVILSELPDATPTARAGSSAPDAPNADAQGMQTLRKLGIASVRTFTEDLAGRANVEFQPGVIIESIRPGSVAALEGLSRGTIITQVMNADIEDVDSLTREVEGYSDAPVIRLRVADWNPQLRQFQERFVFLEVPRE